MNNGGAGRGGLFALAGAAALAMALIFFAHRARVVARWESPPAYDGAATYYFFVIERGFDLSACPFVCERTHEVFLTRDRDAPTYGHALRFSFHAAGAGDDASADERIKQSTVSWERDGVTLTTASGHRLFVPRAAFVGGR